MSMENCPITLDFTHQKLDEVPQEILDNGQILEELYLDQNDIELMPKVALFSIQLLFYCKIDEKLCVFAKIKNISSLGIQI
jgi:hypothetical protein